MIRNVISLVIIVASVIALAMFAGPQYQDVKELQVKSGELDEALEKAAELRAAREELLAKRNQFQPSDLAALEVLLPSSIDNVKLSNDLNALALGHRLVLRDFTVSEGEAAITGGDEEGDGPLGSAVIQFSTTGRYADFVAFLTDIEKSLRIIDIDQLNFNSLDAQEFDEGRLIVDDVYEYQVSFTTYWLQD